MVREMEIKFIGVDLSIGMVVGGRRQNRSLFYFWMILRLFSVRNDTVHDGPGNR